LKFFADETMIDQGMAQQLASMLAPYLPYLTGPTFVAGKDVAMKALGGKFIDASWDKALRIWNKLWPEVQKKPEAAKTLKKLADKGSDPRVEAALSIELEELDLLPEVLAEILSIASEKGSLEIRNVSAKNGSIAVGGSIQGSTINLMGSITPRSVPKKTHLELRVNTNRIYIRNGGSAEATNIKVFINVREADAWDGFARGDLPFRKSLKPGQETHRLWSGPCFGGPRSISYKITWINEDGTSGEVGDDDFRLF